MPQKTKTFKNQQPHTKKRNNKKHEQSDVLRSTLPLKAKQTRTTNPRKTRPHGGNQRSKLSKQNAKKKKKILKSATTHSKMQKKPMN